MSIFCPVMLFAASEAKNETKAAISATDLTKAKNKIESAKAALSKPAPQAQKRGVMGAAEAEEPEATKQLRENILKILES